MPLLYLYFGSHLLSRVPGLCRNDLVGTATQLTRPSRRIQLLVIRRSIHMRTARDGVPCMLCTEAPRHRCQRSQILRRQIALSATADAYTQG